MWTNTSVCTPISVSQRVGGVTESWTVLTSPMKSFVPLWYLALFLLRIAVLLDITSVQMISASRPYCVVMASQTVLMERMSTAALCCSVSWENWCVKVRLLVFHFRSAVITLQTVCLFTLMNPAVMFVLNCIAWIVAHAMWGNTGPFACVIQDGQVTAAM